MSKSSVAVNAKTGINGDEVDESTKPDFIYGGPFIAQQKEEPFVNTSTPINVCLQGTFKRSFAYYSLKERLPVILTKVIDYLSREGAKVKSESGASDDEVRKAIQAITKLKSDLITNKTYDPFTVDTNEARLWNDWIKNAETPRYFTNTWLFSECYVYRKLREAFELNPKLTNFDPFSAQKEEAFAKNLENMCLVAEKMPEMLQKGDADKRKTDFVTLLKLCLWANKCDLSLSLGSIHDMVTDPFKMITDLKDKLLVDDTGKIADQVVIKAADKAKLIEGADPSKASEGSVKPAAPSASPTEAVEGAEVPEEPKIPCPAKMTLPSTLFFDIVCDNAGYELFADLCLAQFLIEQEIVKKVRFHVKNIPWFVSDVTPRDFRYVIEACLKSQFSKEIPAEVKPEPPGGDTEPAEPPPPTVVTAAALQALAAQWLKYTEDGTFIVLADDFWTSPHPFKDMKRYKPNLYRLLQYAVAIMFKGDLNYRKLLADKNWNPVTGFEPCLQGFIPAPLLALRTVKSEVICGLGKGKFEQIMKIDEKWMEKGDFGVIQFCPKAEPLKISDRPCLDYPGTCPGNICPVHTDI